MEGRARQPHQPVCCPGAAHEGARFVASSRVGPGPSPPAPQPQGFGPSRAAGQCLDLTTLRGHSTCLTQDAPGFSPSFPRILTLGPEVVQDPPASMT